MCEGPYGGDGVEDTPSLWLSLMRQAQVFRVRGALRLHIGRGSVGGAVRPRDDEPPAFLLAREACQQATAAHALAQAAHDLDRCARTTQSVMEAITANQATLLSVTLQRVMAHVALAEVVSLSPELAASYGSAPHHLTVANNIKQLLGKL